MGTKLMLDTSRDVPHAPNAGRMPNMRLSKKDLTGTEYGSAKDAAHSPAHGNWKILQIKANRYHTRPPGIGQGD